MSYHNPNLPRPPADGHTSARLALPRQQARSTGYTYPTSGSNPDERAFGHGRITLRADAPHTGAQVRPQGQHSHSRGPPVNAGPVSPTEEGSDDWGNEPYYVESKSQDQSEERSVKAPMPASVPPDQARPQASEEPSRDQEKVEEPSREVFQSPGHEYPQGVEEEDDGGWGSGQTSAPSQPFNVGNNQRAPYVESDQSQPPNLSSTRVSASSSAHRSQGPTPTSTVEARQRPSANLAMTSRFVQRSISNTYAERFRPPATLNPPNAGLDIGPIVSNPPRSQEPENEVSTHVRSNNGPTFLVEAGSRDANRITVPRLRSWGAAPPQPEEGRFDDQDSTHTPALQAAAVDIQGPRPSAPAIEAPLWSSIGSPLAQVAWDTDDRTQQWANSITAVSSQEEVPTAGSEPEAFGGNIHEVELTRPDSAIEPAPPVVVEYSDEEDESTPALTPQRSNSPCQEPEEVQDPATQVDNNPRQPPTVLSVTVGDSQTLIPPASPVQTQATRRGARSHGPRSDRHRPNNEWWKRPPHPMYSAKFASQRIFVQLPNPVRLDHFKQNMLDHFSRYGQVRAVFHYEPTGSYCEKGFVVFQETKSVSLVFADPERHKLRFRSGLGSQVASTELELIIKHSSASHMSRAIFIRVTGSRADEKARSASPRLFPHDAANGRDLLSSYHTAILPSRIIVDAVPQRMRDGTRISWWARIRPTDQTFDSLASIAVADTGRQPQKIGEIDLRRRIAEKDIIPSLCNFFAEVLDIYPPTARGQGWLVTVSGAHDARNLMSELQKIPGFFVRWADETDGYYPVDGPEVAPSTVHEEPASPVTPITRLHNQMEGRPSRPSRRIEAASQATVNLPITPITPQPAPLAPNTSSNASIVAPTPLAAMSHPAPQFGLSPTHPMLRRGLIHTYRGRMLTEDVSTGEPRYFDERAIFVGRLVKGLETAATLLQRFAKYGKVCTIEYNPKTAMSTYASARILFQEKDAADRAIALENGATSNGSAIKVEPRKVLPSEVYTKEMYIDELGRAISPSMVSQYSYSPRSPHIPPVDLPPQTTNPYVTTPSYSHAPYPYPAPLPAYMPIMPTYPVNMYYPQPVSTPVNNPAMPNHVPAPTMPAPAHTAESHLPVHLQYPMLCAAWGVSYLPAGAMPGSVPFYPPQQPPPGPSPPPSPGTVIPPLAPIPIGVPTPEPSPPSLPSEFEMPEGLLSKSKLLPIGFREEDGMVKAIYDQEALKAYCEEAGLSPPPAKKDDLPVHAEEPVTLLPVQTGGHDSLDASRNPVHVPHPGPDRPLDERRSDRSIQSRRHSYSASDRQQPRTKTVQVPIPFSPIDRALSAMNVPQPSYPVQGQGHGSPAGQHSPRHVHQGSDITAHSLQSERMGPASPGQQVLPASNRWSSSSGLNRDQRQSRPASSLHGSHGWIESQAGWGSREERRQQPERRQRGRGQAEYAT
ncbi:hypothetical protein IAU59_003921 [Kwoniella sp. CBS 9459]